MPLHNQPAEQWMSRTTMPESPIVTVAKVLNPISADAQAYVNQKSFAHRLRKNEMLFTPGEVCSHLYFVRKGILRGYVKDGIKDITTWITGEGEFVSAIASFQLQQITAENVQAIEDCELTGLHYDDLQYLYENFPEANIVGRKIYEKYYRDAEERAFIARLTEATSKYKHFIATKSQLLNRVPLKFIASYLGMTLETLSRIRSKLSQSKQ
ncbi:Crp/Fnr family transcriptional regulator [Pseudobacter ginsenosidimutans]|uniref:CRP-like cAMP-binding protein n=1 Tax=Pseudobacter ginsenosidimutans TaxID=661488 RepID=A0A4Q7MUA8_9BACT|nr:Crp/Fnr family transcriptional regulator [Pseudobacter ginsenosidimutans]QEC40794.1 Crp/Fnr family transcriptional regulator [Pseudobacter ginsenosidimutans]RZS72476.1 CRP-like cAMP-binding protein [Pseudobacter ginsenosidimutans]